MWDTISWEAISHLVILMAKSETGCFERFYAKKCLSYKVNFLHFIFLEERRAQERKTKVYPLEVWN